MCSSLTDQVRSIAVVTTAVAQGNLTQKVEIEVEGEMATLKGTVNSMVDQLGAFAAEVTRVALEVGTQGILGGQARVEGVQGTWADLTRNVNVRAETFTNPCGLVADSSPCVENGQQLDGPSTIHLGGYQGRCVGRLDADCRRRRSGRDA